MHSIIYFCIASFSLFPEVYSAIGDAIYGFPLSGKRPLTTLLPFTLQGTCRANEAYTINSIKDFWSHIPEIECIFRGSRIPSKMPTGPLYATCLTMLNTRSVNPFVEAIWEGKFIRELTCNGTKSYVGWNAFPTGPTMPFVPRIGPHRLNLAPEEKDDGKGGLVVEYKTDVYQYCPELKEEMIERAGQGGFNGDNVWSKNIPFMDVIRFVGKQVDGGNIYLLKTYLRDPFRKDQMAVTSAFTAILNYDEKAEEEFSPGVSTLPLEEDVTYKFPGLIDLLMRIIPFDNFILNPGSVGQVAREGGMWRNNALKFLLDIPNSYGRILRNSVKWMKMYRADKY